MKRLARQLPVSIIGLCSRSAFRGLAVAALLLTCSAPFSQGAPNRSFLTINEIGPTHRAPAIVTHSILSALRPERFEVEMNLANLRGNLEQGRLPLGSALMFRSLKLWEAYKWTAFAGALILLALSLVILYLLSEKKQLRAWRAAHEQLSGMLINAQEAERSRLAAEIHDDFSQRLAMLALGLGIAADNVSESPQEAARQLQVLSNDVSNIGGDLHTLSHRLHSASLESLGLVPSVSAYCREFSAKQGIRIEFTHDQVPRNISPDAALCVYRIVQEGLRNVKKHSRASCAQVRIDVVEGTMHLQVRDQGAGFNPREIWTHDGLGTRTMAERAHLLGGRFEIRSKTGKGTSIDVQLPLKRKSPLSLPGVVMKAVTPAPSYNPIRKGYWSGGYGS
jgi:signal transduction histidine kinase